MSGQLQGVRQEKPLHEGPPPILLMETPQLLSLPEGRVGSLWGQGTLPRRGRLGAELRSPSFWGALHVPWASGCTREMPGRGFSAGPHSLAGRAPCSPALPGSSSSHLPLRQWVLCQHQPGRLYKRSKTCARAPEQRLPCPLFACPQGSGPRVVSPQELCTSRFPFSPPRFCLSGPAPSLSTVHRVSLWALQATQRELCRPVPSQLTASDSLVSGGFSSFPL